MKIAGRSRLLPADAGGTFNDAAFPATVGVAGVAGIAGPSLEGVAPSLAYDSGTFTSAAQLAGLAPPAGAPGQAGSYTVVASFSGRVDHAASLSADRSPSRSGEVHPTSR